MQSGSGWNPMEDAYKNQAFNKYESGPGADLDDNLQPGAIAGNRQNSENKFVICLKHVPTILGENGIRNLCATYGNVISINTSPKTPFMFVRLATMNDMERTLTGLRNNTFGIIAEVAKQSQRSNENATNSNISETSSKENRSNNNEVDMSRRNIRGPFTKPPRPNINSETTPNQYPFRNDSRNNVRSPNFQQMNGDINESFQPEYVNASQSVNPNVVSLGNCQRCRKLANKVCQRCGEFYCSVECQKLDWSKHKYACFPMPKLVDPDLKEVCVIEVNSGTTGLKTIPSLSDGKGNEPNKLSPNKNQLTSKSSVKSGNESFEEKTKKKPEKESPNKNESIEKYTPIKNNNKLVEFPKNGSTVCITSFSKTNSMYIRSANKLDNENYVKTVNTINVKGMQSKLLEKMPKINDVVITAFQNTGFYRAVVVQADNPNSISVRYLDFGNVETKKLSELKELPSGVIELKQFVHAVTLKNVPEFTLTEKLTECMNAYVDELKDFKLVYQQLDGKREVDLIDLSTNENLNKKILQFKEVKVAKPSDKPVFAEDIQMKLLKDGENILVFVFDNSLVQQALISCIHEDDIPILNKFNREFEEYASRVDGPYTPRQSEMCIAQYDEDGKWYRAECMEVVGDGNPSVMFIDFGNITTVHISKIRKYPKDLIRPCFTSLCLIADLPDELSVEVADRLKSLIPINEKIVIDKVETIEEDKVNVIHLNTVFQTLKSEKLI